MLVSGPNPAPSAAVCVPRVQLKVIKFG